MRAAKVSWVPFAAAIALLAPSPRTQEGARPKADPEADATLLVDAVVELAAVGVQVDAGRVVVARPDAEELARYIDQSTTAVFGADWFEMLWAVLGTATDDDFGSPAAFRSRYMQDTLTGQAAWYVPEGSLLLLGPRAADADLSLLVAHELVHAAQDQRGGLRQLQTAYGRTTDALLLARCLCEGEAEAAVLAVLSHRRGRDLRAMPEAMFRVRPNEQEDNAMLLHYALGRERMVRAFRAGGWPAVRREFETPPPHTAALAHPERTDWPPTLALAMPDWPAAGGTAVAVRDDTWGELGIRMMLRLIGVVRQRPADPDAIRLAAIGWRGDALRLWRTEPGDYAFVWRAAFDRDADAAQVLALLDGCSGQLQQRRAVVEWIAGPADLVELLLEPTAALPLPAAADDASAAATAELERPIERTRAQVQPAPTPADGSAASEPARWNVPDLGASIAAPAGFEATKFNGTPVLLAPIADDEVGASFRDNLVAVAQLVPEASLQELLANTRKTLAQAPFEAVEVDLRELGGREVLWMEYFSMQRVGRLHHVEVAWLVDGQRHCFSASALGTRWGAIGPQLRGAVESVQFAP